MALQPLKIVKNWLKNSRTREENWDEIRDNIISWSTRTNNNLKQLGLDINTSTYNFNNNGNATQTTAIVPRLDALEAASFNVGLNNIGLGFSGDDITVQGADGTALSATNIGYVTFNETADGGDTVTRNLTANITLQLQGCHWGQGTLGDLSDVRLWVMFIDRGASSDPVLGVAFRGGRETVTTADDETVATSVNSAEKVFVSGALSTEGNCVYLGWVKADFDDTGNLSGEDYWTFQTDPGDVNLGYHQTYIEGEIRF